MCGVSAGPTARVIVRQARAGVLANTIKFVIIISFAITQHNDVRNDQIKRERERERRNTTRVARDQIGFLTRQRVRRQAGAYARYLYCNTSSLHRVCVDDNSIRQQVAASRSSCVLRVSVHHPTDPSYVYIRREEEGHRSSRRINYRTVHCFFVIVYHFFFFLSSRVSIAIIITIDGYRRTRRDN